MEDLTTADLGDFYKTRGGNLRTSANIPFTEHRCFIHVSASFCCISLAAKQATGTAARPAQFIIPAKPWYCVNYLFVIGLSCDLRRSCSTGIDTTLSMYASMDRRISSSVFCVITAPLKFILPSRTVSPTLNRLRICVSNHFRSRMVPEKRKSSVTFAHSMRSPPFELRSTNNCDTPCSISNPMCLDSSHVSQVLPSCFRNTVRVLKELPRRSSLATMLLWRSYEYQPGERSGLQVRGRDVDCSNPESHERREAEK